MSTNHVGLGEPGEPGEPRSRRRRLVLLATVVAVVVAGLVWWRASDDGPAPTAEERRLAVPGVVRAASPDDGPDAVFLDPDLDGDERRAALAGISTTLAGGGVLDVGVDGAAETEGSPDAAVQVTEEDTGEGLTLLADLLPVLVATASRPGDRAEAGLGSSGLRVQLEAGRDRVGTAARFVDGVVKSGRDGEVTELEVTGADGRQQPTGPLRLQCASGVGGLVGPLSAVRRLPDRAVVTSGRLQECGDDVSLDVEVPERADVTAVRRAARAELGRTATVDVAVDGGPRVSGSGDERVALGLVDRLESAGAEVTDVAGVSSATVTVDDLAGYAEALGVFADAAPAQDRRFSATLADGASYSGPVDAQQRTLPLLRRLADDGWRTSYTGDDPDTLAV